MSGCHTSLSILLTTSVGSSVCKWLNALLHFNPANNACFWLTREWVATISCSTSSLLMTPALGSSASEWLLWLTAFYVCWSCWLLALQQVSSCYNLLCFNPADYGCPLLFSLWVIVIIPHCVWSLLTTLSLALQEVCGRCALLFSSLLTMSVLGPAVCRWLLCLAMFSVCWQYLSLAH